MRSSSRVVVLGSAALVGLVFSLTGCSGGSAPGPITEGSGRGSPSEGSPGSSSGAPGSRDEEGTNGTSNGPASDAPASSPPDEDEETPSSPPSTPPAGGSAGPRPACVAFANHQCACNGSHATANCTTSLATGCEAGVKNCSSQLAWYTCVTANACGTNACVGLGKGPC